MPGMSFILYVGDELKSRSWIPLLSIYLIWGSTYLAIRFAVESIPPFFMAATRFLLPGVLLFVWQRLKGEPNPSPKEWKSTSLIGLLLLVGGNGGVTWAEQYIPSGIAALIIGSVPLWIILINFFRHERGSIEKKGLIGAVIGFFGIFILIGPSQISGSPEKINPAGLIAILLAALFWSIGSIYSRTAPMPRSPLMSTGVEFLAGGIGLAFMGLITGEITQLNLSSITLKSIYSLLYLIVFGSLIGFVAYTWLLRNVPISIVSTYAYVNPLIAILIGNRMADEPLNLRILLAALIIIGSVFIINRSTLKIPQQDKKLS